MNNSLKLVENKLDNNNEQDRIRVGKQIRDLRKAKGMTLIDLADSIKRSVGYVSQVERGVSTLSIPVLQAISDALEVNVTWFFHSEKKQNADEIENIVRADSRRHLDYYGTGIHEELLSPRLSGEILMIKTTLDPLAKSDDTPRQRKGKEEAGYIQSGKLELTIGDKHYSLKKGDSFSITGNEPHFIKNPAKAKNTVILWVISGSF